MAEALRKWLPDVIQACEPWISSEDIDPGTRWSSDLAKQLEQTQFGIICLTPENLGEPWINFEAGAISKKLSDKTRLCPYLLGLEPTDIDGPLVQFQAIKAEETDTKKLVQTVNRALGKALTEERIDRAFDLNWPDLEKMLKEILASDQEYKETKRPDGVKLDEILEIVREQSRTISDLPVLIARDHWKNRDFYRNLISPERVDLQIETLALAIYKDVIGFSLGRKEDKPWDELDEKERESYRAQAAEILKTMAVRK